MKALQKYKLARSKHLWQKQHKIQMTWGWDDKESISLSVDNKGEKENIGKRHIKKILKIFKETLVKMKTKTLVLSWEGVLKKISSSPATVPIFIFTAKFLKTPPSTRYFHTHLSCLPRSPMISVLLNSMVNS